MRSSVAHGDLRFSKRRGGNGTRADHTPVGCFGLTRSNDQRACHHVSKALILSTQKDCYQPNGIKAGQIIDKPDEVSSKRFYEAGGAPGTVNHANSRNAFARSATIP